MAGRGHLAAPSERIVLKPEGRSQHAGGGKQGNVHSREERSAPRAGNEKAGRVRPHSAVSISIVRRIMTAQRFGIGLSIINLVLLGLLVTHLNRPALAAEAPGMLRGSGLEIVDAQGRVRASISVFPEQK